MLCIIQARLSSKRFKRKILKKIYGKTVIEWVYERASSAKKVNLSLIATSNSKKDNSLVKLLVRKKIPYFRGKLMDVSSRYLHVAQLKKQEYFVRISGDSPLIDPEIIDHTIIYFKKNIKNKPDLITNIFPRSLPSGQSVEIINTKTLKNNIKKFTKLDKEHVTRYFYRKSKKFKILNISFKNKLNFKMSIDSKEDFNFVKSKINKKNFKSFKIL